MPVDFVEDAPAAARGASVLDFVPDEEAVPAAQPQARLGDWMQQPDVELVETSPRTPGAPVVSLPGRGVTDLEGFGVGQGEPGVDVAALEQGVRQEPPALESEIQPFGKEGTFTRGVGEVVAGVLNRPELLAALANPATAAAVTAMYAPSVAKQFFVDFAAGIEGDEQALGRAAAVGLPVIAGGTAMAGKQIGKVARGLEEARVAERIATPGGTEWVLPRATQTLEEIKAQQSAGKVVTENASRLREDERQVPTGRDVEKGSPGKGSENLEREPQGRANRREREEVKQAGAKSAGKPVDFVPDDLQAEARASLVEELGTEVAAPARAAAPTAAEVAKPAATTSEIVGMGGAVPGEFAPVSKTATSIKNATVEQERAARGLPPATIAAQRSFGEVWDRAMATIDRDPAAQDTLLSSLRQRPRAVTDVEDALLLHRQIDLQNEYGKATRDLAQAVDDGRFEDAAVQRDRVAGLSDQLLDLYNVNKLVGTETGRGLAARKMLANEDFTLAAMTTTRRAAKGGKRLTDREVKEVEQAHKEVSGAMAEVEAANATAGAVKPGVGGGVGTDGRAGGRAGTGGKPAREPKAVVDAEFKLDKAKRKWHDKLREDAEAELPLPRRLVDSVGGGWNNVRSWLTSLDLSAVLRQGKLVVLSRPVTAARAVPSMFRALGSEKAAFAIDREILARPNAASGLYERSGLYLAEHGKALSKMEEAYMSRLADKMPLVKASQRAYTTFLNKLRADTFDTLAATLGRKGEITLAEAKVLANYVNAATGRGDLGKFNAAAVPLATVFFSPRFVASRFQMLLGQPLYHGVLSGKVGWAEGARARKLVAGEYARILTGVATVYLLAELAGADVEADPRSSDFGKLRTGETRVDPMAGLLQNTVLLSRLGSGETKTLKGRVTPLRGEDVKFGGATSVDVLSRFLRSKLAPASGALVDLVQGEDIVGQPVTAASEAKKLLVPITYQDILATMEEQGVPRGTALLLLSIFGEGVQTYDETR